MKKHNIHNMSCSVALDEPKIQEGFSDVKKLPKFPNYEGKQSFKESLFFKKHYDLGDRILQQLPRGSDRFITLKPDRNIQKLQQMLIFLGCMQEKDLLGTYNVSEGKKENISYFGIGGPTTFGRVSVFQKESHILVDGKVGPETKEHLYKRIYEIFHIPGSISRHLAILKKEISD